MHNTWWKKKTILKFSLLIQWSRILLYRLLSSNHPCGQPVRRQPLQLAGAGEIKFGENVQIGYFPSPFFFSTYAYIDARNPEAKITIGSNTAINNNFSAISEHTCISIGDHCFIGTNVEISDSDFHGLKIHDRAHSLAEWAKPVQIGDNVFIGSNVRILKGVTIGNGAVIANGALVTNDVAANTVVGGVPAKLIKTIE